MKSFFYVFLLTLGMLTLWMSSCRNPSYKELTSKKEALEKTLGKTRGELRDANETIMALKEDTTELGKEKRAWKKKYEDLLREFNEQKKKLKDITDNYNKLKSTKSQEIQDLVKKLEKLQKNLQDVQRRLAARDEALRALKERIRKALLGFEESGLTVEEKNGKIYVSLSNKLLFESGRYDLNTNGKKALMQLSEVLKQTQDVQIQVEGHTDSEAYRSGVLVDNWDLSVKRSTEVVRYMVEDGGVKPERLTASGHGEHMPIATNETAEGRAKNRRTEIILVPNLEDVFKILEQETPPETDAGDPGK